MSPAWALLVAVVAAGCCANSDEVQVPSPDGKDVARSYLSSCGATTGHTTHVDLNVDGSGWRSVYTANRAYNVTLRWATPRELLILCNGCPPRHPDAPPEAGITITVVGAPPAAPSP